MFYWGLNSLRNGMKVLKELGRRKYQVWSSDLSSDLCIPLDEIQMLLNLFEQQGYCKLRKSGWSITDKGTEYLRNHGS